VRIIIIRFQQRISGEVNYTHEAVVPFFTYKHIPSTIVASTQSRIVSFSHFKHSYACLRSISASFCTYEKSSKDFRYMEPFHQRWFDELWTFWIYFMNIFHFSRLDDGRWCWVYSSIVQAMRDGLNVRGYYLLVSELKCLLWSVEENVCNANSYGSGYGGCYMSFIIKRKFIFIL
jgi:hypothetical protein